MKNYADYAVDKISSFYGLYQRFSAHEDIIAVSEKGREYSYGQLKEDIKRVYAQIGCGRAFVLINCKSKYNFIINYFATVLSGNIACLQPYFQGVAPCYKNFDFALIADDGFADNARAIAAKEEICDKATDDAPCTALSSSGTTSEPKAIALSQRNIISDLIAGMEKYLYSYFGRYVSILPYSHAFGLVCDLLGPLYSFSTLYVADDVMSFFASLPVYNPTALNVTPGLAEAVYGRIAALGSTKAAVGDSLVKILSGGAETSARLCDKMRSVGIKIYGCYGLSECSPCVCVNRDDYYEDGSVGIALNCNTLSLEEGVIVVTGDNVMLGYYDSYGRIVSPTNGVFRTGDLGEITKDGFLYVLGRADDVLVLKSGVKLVPQQAEGKINAIEGVAECVVYLKYDGVAATVVVSDINREKEVRSAVNSLSFDGIKINEVEITRDPLERNALGKLQRKSYGQR